MVSIKGRIAETDPTTCQSAGAERCCFRATCSSEAAAPVAVKGPSAGPLLSLARETTAALERLKETLEIDELDACARRHVRTPASGAAEALLALGYVAHHLPGLFRRADVNLRLNYVLSLLDRKRAVDLLDQTLFPLASLMRDTKMDLDEEMVDLLSAGLALLDGALSPTDHPALGEAFRILSAYRERIAAEAAHTSAEQRKEARFGRHGGAGVMDRGAPLLAVAEGPSSCHAGATG
jgi:hypothetical protein